MAAAACLRVLADNPDLGPPDSLVGVVAKLTVAFLDSRWVWPRRHGRVGPSAFLLADPRALEFDAEELRNLAQELQAKLFGVESAGEVSLLLFEGPQEEITRFATCTTEALYDALDGAPGAMPLAGRIRRVTTAGVIPVVHKGDPDPESASTGFEQAQPTLEELVEQVQRFEAAAPAGAAKGPKVGFHAVYFTPKTSVIGSVVSGGQFGASSLRGVFGKTGYLQGEAAQRYDERCMEGCASLLRQPFGGVLFFPISFSSIMHRPTRELYLPVFDLLPVSRPGQLAASVYDVPRDPTFGAMSQLTAFLRKYFSFINLQVTDPGFRVEKLLAGVVNSVTLVAADTDQQARLSAIKRFMDNRDSYKRQKIWPAVSHLRNKAELDFCLVQKTSFVSGPAVSDLLDAPAEVRAYQPAELPIRRIESDVIAKRA